MSDAKRLDRPALLSSLRHPARRDGVIALAFLLLPGLIALALERRDHHLDGGTVATLVSVALGLPVLWLTWAVFRDSRIQESDDTAEYLSNVADQLAVAVREQWEAEAATRRLNDPYPLPVSWTAAGDSLADPWDVIVTLATSGAGWPAPSMEMQADWANRADELAGTGNQLAKVLEKVPTRRLVVLGDPGSGKTMLMIRLVLDKLANRLEGAPVPILVSLTSWNPSTQSLHDWLAGRLATDYFGLASAPPLSRHPSSITGLLRQRLILPILDGLDEMPAKARALAIARMNDSLRPGEPVVLTCRVEVYRDIVSSAADVPSILRGAASIQLCPLESGMVSSYLLDDASRATAPERWRSLLTDLGTSKPIGQAFVNPLMVGLARTIYNPRPGDQDGDLRDPAELSVLPDRAMVEAHLLDAFIPASYRQRAGSRWRAEQAETWLVFIARHLEHDAASADFAWWRLPLVKPKSPLSAALVAALVLAAGLWTHIGLLPVFISVLIAPAFEPLLFNSTRARPARSVRPMLRRLTTCLGIGLLAGIALGALASLMTIGYLVGSSPPMDGSSSWPILLSAHSLRPPEVDEPQAA